MAWRISRLHCTVLQPVFITWRMKVFCNPFISAYRIIGELTHRVKEGIYLLDNVPSLQPKAAVERGLRSLCLFHASAKPLRLEFILGKYVLMQTEVNMCWVPRAIRKALSIAKTQSPSCSVPIVLCKLISMQDTPELFGIDWDAPLSTNDD